MKTSVEVFSIISPVSPGHSEFEDFSWKSWTTTGGKQTPQVPHALWVLSTQCLSPPGAGSLSTGSRQPRAGAWSLQTAAWSAGRQRAPIKLRQEGSGSKGDAPLWCYGGLQTLFSWEYCEVIGQGRPQILPGGQSLFTLFQWEKCSAVSKQRAHYSMLGDVNRPKQEHNPRCLALASGLTYFRLLV